MNRATSHGVNANPQDEDERSECEALSYLVTRFATKEIAPHVQAWDQAGEFPRELYLRADRKSTRLNSSHLRLSRMPSSA